MKTTEGRRPVIPERLRGQRQAGFSAVAGAFMLILFATVTALLVNVGQLYYAQRNLQKLATLAALDASRTESGCYSDGSGTPGSLAAAQATVNDTLAKARNLTSGVAIASVVEFGKYTSSNGARVFTPLPETDGGVDSVRVTLTRPQPSLLIPFLSAGPGATLTAVGVAEHAPTASYLLGTTLLNIDTTKSKVLNALLPALLGSGTALSLTAVDYQGLADASVTAAALATQLGINLAADNAADLLDTAFAIGGANGLLSALTNAVGATGNTVAEGVLNQIEAIAGGGRTATLRQILGVENGAENLIGNLPVNVLALAISIAENAGLGYFPITVNNLGLDLGLVKLTTYLSIGQPAQPGNGRPGYVSGVARSPARTAQITLALRAKVDALGLATVKLGVDATVASATGALASIRCPMGAGALASNKATVNVDVTPSVANVTVGSFSDSSPGSPILTGPQSLISVNLGGIAGLSVNLSNPLKVGPVGGGSTTTLSFTGPPFSSQTTGSAVDLGGTVAGLNLGNITVCATILFLPVCLPLNSPLLNTLLSPVLTAVTTLLSTLDSVLNDLLAALGVEVGSATVTIEGLSYGNTAGRDSTSSGSVPALYNQQKPGETGR